MQTALTMTVSILKLRIGSFVALAALVFACSDLAALLLRRYAWFKPLPFACAAGGPGASPGRGGGAAQ